MKNKRYIFITACFAFFNSVSSHAGGSIISGGGLGGSYPSHYFSVSSLTKLNDGAKWSDFQGTHLKQLTEAALNKPELSKVAKQQIIEVIFKAVTFHSKNFDTIEKENTYRFWDTYLHREANQRMPNADICRSGIMNGKEEDVLKGCGLSLVGVSLAPQGSWLDGLGVQPDDTWESVKYKGKPLTEMNGEQTLALLRSAYARLAERGSPNFMNSLERDYLIQFAFKRVLYFKDGLSSSDREKIATEWVQNLMVRARINLPNERECRSAIQDADPKLADKSCGFSDFSFKTIVHSR